MSGRWTIKAFDSSKFGQKETPMLKEAAFWNNAGISEIGKFFMECEDPNLMKKYEDLVDKASNEAIPQEQRDEAEYQAWQIIQNFTRTRLQGEGPWKHGYRARERERLKNLMLNVGGTQK